jgi:hypothetical protein
MLLNRDFCSYCSLGCLLVQSIDHFCNHIGRDIGMSAYISDISVTFLVSAPHNIQIMRSEISFFFFLFVFFARVSLALLIVLFR